MSMIFHFYALEERVKKLEKRVKKCEDKLMYIGGLTSFPPIPKKSVKKRYHIVKSLIDHITD